MLHFLRFILLAITLLSTGRALASGLPSPEEQTQQRLEEIIRQRPYRDYYLTDMMLELSEYQDALLVYMYNCEDQAAFVDGLRSFDKYDNDIRYKTSNYLTRNYNFYARSWESQQSPQTIAIESIWGKQTAFLNTFKTGNQLSAEERELYFKMENDDYQADAITRPFLLDDEAIKNLEPELLYNFTLLPNGTVTVALERPGEKEYHVRDEEIIQAFTHPNHTILAGSPHQAVLTAGAFIMYEQGDKRLYFISSKSGHFQPSYDSLEQMQRWFSEHGVDKATVVALPDVDMAQHTFDHYSTIEVPVLATEVRAKKLFKKALVNWQAAFDMIDRDALFKLGMGDLTCLNEEVINQIKTGRDEANSMRDAYRLFSSDHTAPEIFNLFVKRFGRLKDAIKFNAKEKIQTEALLVSTLLSSYGQQIEQIEVGFTTEKAFVDYVISQGEAIYGHLIKEVLHMDDYHSIKKINREFSTLFRLLAEENRYDGQHFFLYNSVANAFDKINNLMADVHSAYVGKELSDTDNAPDPYVVVTNKMHNKIIGTLNRIDFEAPNVDLRIDDFCARQLAARASFEWWSIHDKISKGNINRLEDKGGIVKRLLIQILEGNVTASQEELHIALARLVELRKSAQMSLDLYVLLDYRHGIPSEIDDYIWALESLINEMRDSPQTLKNNEFIAAQIYAFIADSGWPDRRNKPYSFRSDSQEGIAHSIQQAIDAISLLRDVEVIAVEDAEKIRDKARQLAVIFNLIRVHMGVMLDEPAYKLRFGGSYVVLRTSYGVTNGPYFFIEDYRTMSLSSYKSVALHLEKLQWKLTEAIESGSGTIAILEEEQQLAQHLFNKLDNAVRQVGEPGDPLTSKGLMPQPL